MKVLKITNLAAVALLAVPLAGFGQDGYGPMPGGYQPAAYGPPAMPADGMIPPYAYGPQQAVNAYGEPILSDPYAGSMAHGGDVYGSTPGGYFDPPPASRYWVSGEYLGWRAKGQDIPALLTTSPLGTPQGQAGEIDREDTEVLFGNTGIDDEFRSGARITFGFWATEGEYTGYQVEYMGLTDAHTHVNTSSTFSDGSSGQILARPFFNLTSREQDAIILAFPGFQPDVGGPADLDGTFSARSYSSTESVAVTRRDLMWADAQSGYKAYFLAGYRYFNLDEGLRIDDRINPVGGFFPTGSFIDSRDEFDVRNNFHGLEIGINSQYGRGPLKLDLLTKLAFGNSHQVLHVDGETLIYNGFVLDDFQGGTLTAPTNIGRHKQNEFAMMPEFGVNLSYQVTTNLKLTIGYSFVYYSSVIRPGDQIDLGLNPSQFDGGTLVGDARPSVELKDTDYFLYGGNAGIEWRW